MSSRPIIEVAGVTKRFQTFDRPFDRLVQVLTGRERHRDEHFTALSDVTFGIRDRESVGIIGVNGSGKSTLLQIIAGTLEPTEGSVRVDARIAALLELGAGFNPEFTGRENVYLNGALLGLSQEQIDDRFDSIAAFAEIGEHIEMPVKTYSSGMYVRLAFAIAAHVDADVLIIDEALSVGDVRFGQKCMRFLHKFRETGSLIFVSHDPSAVVTLCSRAIWIDRGNLRMDGAAKDVVEKYLAEQHSLDRLEVGDVVQVQLDTDGASSEALRPAIDYDPRQELIDASNGRNLIELFHFEEPPSERQFGAGRAKLVSVTLVPQGGRAQSLMLGGELVELRVEYDVVSRLDNPIAGFYVKNRLGQRIFGDNTFLSYADQQISYAKGARLQASFAFRMPLLPSGDYSIDIALATGSQEDHTAQLWVHDALSFRASDESMRGGLVGIPMHAIELRNVRD